MNIEDLKIAREIIPLFDNHLNKGSSNALTRLFNDIPSSVDEIVYRQDILKAIIKNNNRIASISSYRSDLEEVFVFTESTISTYPLLSGGTEKIWLNYLFDKRSKYFLISKAIQLSLIFNKIYVNYFSSLRSADFPAAYLPVLERMTSTLRSFTKISNDENIFTGNAPAVIYYRILKEAYLMSASKRFTMFWSDFFTHDAYVSAAITIQTKGFTFPDFSGRGIILEHLYHPLIKKPVRNSIRMDNNVLLLTGPNMSGKSTFLKAISICIYLGHIGFGVPADSAKMQFFQGLNVFLNSTDSLQGGLSHFMKEVKQLKTIIEQAANGINSFTVIDEIFSGTNTDDAQELSRITLRGLHKYTNCCFVFSTHLNAAHIIDKNGSDHILPYYLDASINDGIPVFSFELKKGWSDQKFGLLLFEREGLKRLLE